MKEEIIRKGIIKGLKHNFSTGSFPIPCTNKDIEDFINNGLQNPDAKSTYESLKVIGEFIYKKAKEERDKEINEFIIKVSSLIHIDKMNEFEELIKKFKGEK